MTPPPTRLYPLPCSLLQATRFPAGGLLFFLQSLTHITHPDNMGKSLTIHPETAMHFSFDVAGPQLPQTQQTSADQTVPANSLEILRQILEVQKEHLQLSRAIAMASDGSQRSRTFLDRWGQQFPDLAAGCKQILPQLERAYMELMQDLTLRVQDDGPDGLDNEFSMAEFLDRYGMKLGQLGTILNLVTPIAEAYSPQPAAEEES